MKKGKQSEPDLAQEVREVQRTAEQEAQAQAELIKEHNLRFYTEGCEVPADALKPIKAGRLRGMSDVNPMWRMKRMTEIFGPVGFGWRYEIVKQWTETYGNEVKCFCNVHLFVRDPETREWSAPIPGCGGSAIVTMESKGAYVNDEGYKMALTDALSILGIGGNIWYGPSATGHNESKYESATIGNSAQDRQEKQLTSGLLRDAVGEMEATKNQSEYEACWNKWASVCPELTQPTTEFYQAAVKRINIIKNSKPIR